MQKQRPIPFSPRNIRIDGKANHGGNTINADDIRKAQR